MPTDAASDDPDADLATDSGSPSTSSPDWPPPDPTCLAPPASLSRRRRRRRVRRMILAVVVVLMLPVVYSYGQALTGPGTDPWTARSVEWLRDNHLGGVVDWAERTWNNLHPAKKGGTPDVAKDVPRLAVPAAPGALAPGASARAAGAGGGDVRSAWATGSTPAREPHPHRLAPPTPLPTPVARPVPGEGVWRPMGPLIDGKPGAYVTVIRPDAVYTSALDAVVWFDPSVMSFRQYPGLTIPGAPWDRPPDIPVELRSSVLAAFPGGFRMTPSHGGFFLGGKTLVRLRDGAATLAISSNGVPLIGEWGRDFTSTAGLDSARQNLSLIVDRGQLVPDLSTDPNRKWGFTGPANRQAVWRTGIGVRADGAVVWVGGPDLTIVNLAQTLQRAGAVEAMQLDINQEWAQFNTYGVGPDGRVHGTKLLNGMGKGHPADRWLSEDTRDFVAVFAGRSRRAEPRRRGKGDLPPFEIRSPVERRSRIDLRSSPQPSEWESPFSG